MFARVGLAVVTAGFTLYVTLVSTTGGNPWPVSWTWVLIAAVGLGGVLWLAAELPPHRPRGHDFRITYRGGQVWELERLAPAEAFDVRLGDGRITGGSFPLGFEGQSLGDMRPGDVRSFEGPNDTGFWLPLHWIEQSGRYLTKSVLLEPQSSEVLVVGLPVRTGDPYQT